jgi:hypothetical protein
MRTQTYQAGDVVTDLDGLVCVILEVHLDPEDPRFSHCGGVSARYTVRLLDQSTSTRWDWQFTLAKSYKIAPKVNYSSPTSFFNVLKKFFSR